MKSIVHSEFLKQVFTLMFGTSLAQAIPVLVTPVLTRFYTPEDFGVLTIFSAIVTIVGAVVTGKYELAIVLPEDRRSPYLLTLFALVNTIILSSGLLVFIYFFKDHILIWLNNKSLGNWLYLVPLSTLLLGGYNAFNYLNISEEKYKTIAKANVFRSFTSALFQFILFFVKNGPFGLIWGKIISMGTVNVLLGKIFVTRKNTWEGWTKQELKQLAVRYKKFPLFSAPSLLVNALTQNINNFFISFLYSANILGFYGLLSRVMLLPLNLISSAFSQVLLKRASDEIKAYGHAKKSFNYSLKYLLLTGIVIFGVLYFSVEAIFSILFGKSWEMTGQLAKIMVPFFFSRYVVMPLTTMTIVFEKQRFYMFWQFIFLLLVTGIFLTTKIYGLDVFRFFSLFSYIISGHYFFMFVMAYRFSKGVGHKVESRHD